MARVQPVLAAWRRRRKHRERIPEGLWGAMATLAREYGLSPVAQALSVNYTALKGHLEVSAVAPASGTGTGPAPFVEVPVTGWPQAPPWVIELEDRGGSKLTLRLAPGDRAAVLALAQGLWRQRA
jgi:hypothetical protein